MEVHLLDGTYELFRYFFAVPLRLTSTARKWVRLRRAGSVMSIIESGATHIGVATDHVVESFRNDLYGDYKTSEGVAPELLSQFPILEEALQAMGVVVWPMIYFEADDALASAAAKAAQTKSGTGVSLHPGQRLEPVRGRKRVVQFDRRRRQCAMRPASWPVRRESAIHSRLPGRCGR